jgi:1,4-dihydroxy-6-naphthoate synthase
MAIGVVNHMCSLVLESGSIIGPMPLVAQSDARPVIRLGHSPDPDDAFMWWPLFVIDGQLPRLDTGRFRFVPVEQDIQTLNERSQIGDLEITAISCAQYPHVKDRYALTTCGSSMGDAYGPKLISRKPMRPKELLSPEMTIAVPGTRTSAFAAATIMLGELAPVLRSGHATLQADAGTSPGLFRFVAVPFEEIIDRVAAGEFAAGLIIHEGQLTFQHAGLHLVADLGAWWTKEHNLPLPLGVNVIRRDLESVHGPGTLREITTLLLASVNYALAHREESVAYAMRFARDMSSDLADEFIGLYVNKLTLDFGQRGREAVRVFLSETHRMGLTPDAGDIDIIKPA